MEQHPYKAYPAGHHFKDSCVQCGKPKANQQHTEKPDPMFEKDAPSMLLESVDEPLMLADNADTGLEES